MAGMQGPGHAAMYDLVVLLLETKCFISPTPYETFQVGNATSPPHHLQTSSRLVHNLDSVMCESR